jgi:hypothetical protein
MSVAGRTRRGPTVTSYHVQLSDGQESTVIADAAIEDLQPKEHHHREPARRRPRRACGSAVGLNR